MLLYEVHHEGVGLVLGLGFCLLLVALGQGVLGVDALEQLAVVLDQQLGDELIQVVGQVQDLIALVQDPFCLGQLCHLADLLAAGIVDIGLVFLHPFRVLLQGGALGYFGGGEQD